MKSNLILTYRGIDYYPIPLYHPDALTLRLVAVPYTLPTRTSAEFLKDNIVCTIDNKTLVEEIHSRFFEFGRLLDDKTGVRFPENSLAFENVVAEHFDEVRKFTEPLCHKIIDEFLSCNKKEKTNEQ